jgi:hypothetical protein
MLALPIARPVAPAMAGAAPITKAMMPMTAGSGWRGRVSGERDGSWCPLMGAEPVALAATLTCYKQLAS